MNTDTHSRATTIKKLFSRETSICAHIHASAEAIWRLLTNAEGFEKWNSTVIRFSDDIALGKKIKLRSTLAPERTFTLKVKAFEPNTRLQWGDAMGNRFYTLTPNKNGTTFYMREKIGGPLFLLFAKMIPPFDESFERFTQDLKIVAEASK